MPQKDARLLDCALTTPLLCHALYHPAVRRHRHHQRLRRLDHPFSCTRCIALARAQVIALTLSLYIAVAFDRARASVRRPQRRVRRQPWQGLHHRPLHPWVHQVHPVLQWRGLPEGLPRWSGVQRGQQRVRLARQRHRKWTWVGLYGLIAAAVAPQRS
jgi:hypothetical protein